MRRPTTSISLPHVLSWDWLTILAMLVGVLALGCLLLFGLTTWMLRDYDLFSGEITDAAQIEANAALRLPPSARDIRGHQTGFQDILLQARFVIDATDLQTFLASTRCEHSPVAVDPHRQQQAPADPVWWRPMDAQRLRECSGVAGATRQQILIDMTDPTTYIVYISAATY